VSGGGDDQGRIREARLNEKSARDWLVDDWVTAGQ